MKAARVTPFWPGIEGIQNVVVFGDSFSAASDFVTDGLLWVDRAFSSESSELNANRAFGSRIRTHNFTGLEDTIEEDSKRQLKCYFSRFLKKGSKVALDPKTTLYVFWCGINDCGRRDAEFLEEIVETLVDRLQDIYTKSGGRNFLILDLPPIDRAPASRDFPPTELQDRVEVWNEELVTQLGKFVTITKEATVLLFPVHQVISDILNHPGEYGFPKDTLHNHLGPIWSDELHLSCEVHEIIAKAVIGAISSVRPLNGSELGAGGGTSCDSKMVVDDV